MPAIRDGFNTVLRPQQRHWGASLGQNTSRAVNAALDTLASARPTPRHGTRLKTRSQRARTAVILGLVVFLAIQAATNLAIRCEWSVLRDPLYFDKLALFRRSAPEFFPQGRAGALSPGGEPLKVLFIGSSRTQNAVDAQAIQTQLSQHLNQPVSAFNFALAGCGPITNAVYLRRLIQDKLYADVVVIEIHPVFLAGQRPDYPEMRWLVPIRLRRDELSHVQRLGLPLTASPAAGWRGWLAAWYEYRFIIVDRYLGVMRSIPKLNAGHEPDARGFVRCRELTDTERTTLTGLTYLQYQDYFPGFRATGPGLAAVKDMLDVCQSHGMAAILLLTPESTAFRGWYGGEGRLELDRVLNALAKESQVPLIDARDWLADDRIGDGHHVCGSGADQLSVQLSQRLADVILRQNLLRMSPTENGP